MQRFLFLIPLLLSFADTQSVNLLSLTTIPVCLLSTGSDYSHARTVLLGEKKPDEKYNCFVKCIAEKSGLIYEGKLHAENFGSVPMTSTLAPEVFTQIRKCLETLDGTAMKSCGDIDGITYCLRFLKK